MLFYKTKKASGTDDATTYAIGDTFVMLTPKGIEGEPHILIEPKRNKVQLVGLLTGKRVHWPICVDNVLAVNAAEFEQVRGTYYSIQQNFKLTKSNKNGKSKI